jgi:hypothetical protein
MAVVHWLGRYTGYPRTMIYVPSVLAVAWVVACVTR